MAQATSISLSKFTASVQAAVKSAISKHPKFSVQSPQGVTVSYLIRGIPSPEAILKGVTVSETQAFANDVAAGIAGAHPEILSATGPRTPAQGAIISIGGHLVIGIPAPLHPMEIDS